MIYLEQNENIDQKSVLPLFNKTQKRKLEKKIEIYYSIKKKLTNLIILKLIK